jgi:dihydropteroate synthase/2-amino-4-hydroxy-6-hydroxymethyldihydropteridine diphosphokinase
MLQISPLFLNAVVEVELSASRLDELQGLLNDLKAIEEDLGRKAGGIRNGPRVIDLDIIAVGEQVLSTCDTRYPLEVPHARMHERDFVLVPMADLCPEWRHPSRTGNPTVQEMLESLRVAGGSPQEWPHQLLPAAGGLHGRIGGVLWRRGERTLIMGILNATPDSFSDGGDHLDVGNALTAARTMVAGGAHILDVGGESTRPGAAEVPVDDEIGRVVPVIRAIRAEALDVTISIDTRKAAVARAAVNAGADWINDVSGGEFDADMFKVAAELMAPIVLMHMKGDPKTMNSMAQYESVVEDVCNHLVNRRQAAESSGILSWNILVDPGIGFAKNMTYNLHLLRECSSLVQRLQPSPVLLSSSRKRFIGTILNEPDPKRRQFGNAATTAAAIAGGADVVRVHEVKEMAQTALVCDSIYRNSTADVAQPTKDS